MADEKEVSPMARIIREHGKGTPVEFNFNQEAYEARMEEVLAPQFEADARARFESRVKARKMIKR